MVLLLAVLFCGCAGQDAPPPPLVKAKPVAPKLQEPPGKQVYLADHEVRRIGAKEYWAARSWIGKCVALMAEPDMEAALFALHRAESAIPPKPTVEPASHVALTMAVLNGKSRVYLLTGRPKLAEHYIELAAKKATRPMDKAIVAQSRAVRAYQNRKYGLAAKHLGKNDQPLDIMLRQAAFYRMGDVKAKERLKAYYKSAKQPKHIHMLPPDVLKIATE